MILGSNTPVSYPRFTLGYTLNIYFPTTDWGEITDHTGLLSIITGMDSDCFGRTFLT